MHRAAERATEQHLDDLFDQLATTRQRHWITSHILDQRLHLPKGTTRQREYGLYLALLSLPEFAAWSRALGLTLHLTDEYGRTLPPWMPHRLPHETTPQFEVQRLTRTLDLRRDAIPCDLPVLTKHLDITDAAWHDWTAGTTSPELLTIARACIALDVRITLIPLWHEHTLTDLRAMQSDSHWNPTTAYTERAERPSPDIDAD